MKHNTDHNVKKGKRGLAGKYITRNVAIKQVQLPLQVFRRVCVLKGIFPRKPSSYRKVQEGDPTERILYLRSDIQTLMLDPSVWAIRESKQYLRNLHRYIRKKEPEKVRALKRRKPIVNVDHIILERYPSFNHALQDLDDPLCSIFFTAVLSAAKIHPSAVVNKCRRLAIEFMHFIIQAKALRKVFVTMKGYYYRAEIQGIDVTWVVPHPFPIKDDPHTDQSVLQHANEFYVRFMAFVNYKLFQSINLCYPPRIQSYMDRMKTLRSSESTNKVKTKKKIVQAKSDMKNSILALSVPIISKNKVDKDEDQYDSELLEAHFGCKVHEAKEVLQKTQKQKKIFEGLKFYLNMETNRESLTFVIRAAGGEVSWDYSLGQGHRYPEGDKQITHQIVDRPNYEKKYLSRYYVQPQWVYDSFNHALLMPVQDYFAGANLPAHLSPFEETYNDYVPPELKKIQVLQQAGPSIDFDALNLGANLPASHKAAKQLTEAPKPTITKKVKKQVVGEGPLASMMVKRGKTIMRDLEAEARKEDELTKRFAETLINKRQVKLYHKIKASEKNKEEAVETLKKSRSLYEGFKQGKLDKLIDNAKKNTRKVVEQKRRKPKPAAKGRDPKEVVLIGKKPRDTRKKVFYPDEAVWNR